ncbi:MAG: polysaccharide biosynthesis tyrosine autokinase [bacterium]|nr:polysaccharide biosynthesis tyrosine autokinase [bacterium]
MNKITESEFERYEQPILSDEQSKMDWSRIARALFRGRWIIFLSFIVVVTSTAILTSRMQPVYQAETTILIEGVSSIDRNLPMFGNEGVGQLSNRIQNEIELIKSRSLAEAVMKKLLESPYREEITLLKESGNFDDKVTQLRKRIEAKGSRDNDIVRIMVTGASSFEAAYFANKIAETYLEQSLKASRGEVSEVRKFLEDELEKVRARLAASEEARRQYMEEERIPALDAETMKLVEQSSNFRSQLAETETDLNASLRRLDYLRKQLSETKMTLVEDISSISSPLIQQLMKDLAEKQTRLASIQGRGAPGAEITAKSLETEINAIKERLKEETRKFAATTVGTNDPLGTSQRLYEDILSVEIDIKSLTARAEALRTIVDGYEARLEALPEKSLMLARLTRDSQINEKLYLMLKEKYEESRIAEAGRKASVRIIDEAKPPKSPIRPNKRANIIIGVFLGLGIGIFASILIEYTDNSIRTVEDIERLGIPVLGTIPYINLDEITKKLEREGKEIDDQLWEKLETRLITTFSPKSPISEAYRALRTSLLFSDLERKRQVILLTSATTKEGKTTTSCNLAITLASAGMKTLLLDADFRRPSIHRNFRLERHHGITDILLGTLTIEQALKPTELGNLEILTCGEIPPNPAEIIASDFFNDLIQKLRQMYDVIIIDSPPIIAVTDATILAKIADTVILVTHSGYIAKREVLRCVSILKSVGVKLTGVVLNGLDIKRVYGSYYYYYHYYHYYYYYGSKDKQKSKSTRIEKKHVEA